MLFLPLFLVIGAATALAAVAPNKAANKDITSCYSVMATSKCQSKTSYSYHYTPCTLTSTVTKTTTLTPALSSITETSTVTSTSTAPTSSLTSIESSTETDTVTTITTSTVGSTATSTQTNTATATVQPSAGFVPVQDSLPGSSYGGAGGSTPVKREDEEIKGLALFERGSMVQSSPKKYKFPKHVTCHIWTKEKRCCTKTKTLTSTVYAPTPSTTLTTTQTSTSTIYPSATTTITTTVTTISTETDTATTTSTTTSTQTSITTTSVYAACATPNLADTFNGQGFNGIGTVPYGTPNYILVRAPTDAYTCCVASLTYPDSSVNIDGFSWDYTQRGCFLLSNSGTCPSGQGSYSFIVGYGPNSAYVVGNANCGKYTQTIAN